MRAKIGGIEFFDLTMDEADELIKRYGQAAPSEGGTDGLPPPPGGANHKPAGGARGNAADMVILRKMVEAGTQGMPTATLGEMLGCRGKATWGAAKEWAVRMEIASDPDMDPFDETRVGTQRGIRIKPSLMDIAKAHLKMTRPGHEHCGDLAGRMTTVPILY